MSRRILILSCVLGGCTFDTSGLPLGTADRALGDRPVVEGTLRDMPHDRVALDGTAPGDRPATERFFEAGSSDGKPDGGPGLQDGKSKPDSKGPDAKPPDTRPPDTRPPDIKPPPDAGGFKPVGPTEILAAWNAIQVKCVDSSGNWNNTWIKPLDSTTYAVLVDGAVTLAGATADSKAWAGSKPSVTVIFNPNSCGQEDPINSDNDWGSAGLLIRGATLSGGKLLLAPGTTTADMDFLDVTSTGAFEGGSDFAKPDDSLLPSYPQLLGPINALKQGILTASI